MLFIVGYPTFKEIEEAARRGHPEAQRELAEIKRVRESAGPR